MFARLKNQGFTSFKPFLTSGPVHMLCYLCLEYCLLTLFLLLWQTLNFQILAKTSLVQ